jgi:hypothetical protein
MFAKIEDIIVKTIISVEHVVNNAVDMFVPYKNSNCFELFGFDILIDDKMEPWLLEVNLTPAMSCDSPLDQKVKSNCIADLLSLAGVVNIEARNTSDVTTKKAHMAYGGNPGDSLSQMMKNRAPLQPKQDFNKSSGGQLSFSVISEIYQKALISNTVNNLPQSLSKDDRQALKDADDEYKRRGFFKRIFPSPDFLYYKQFFQEDRIVNYLLDARIFAKRRNVNPAQIRQH